MQSNTITKINDDLISRKVLKKDMEIIELTSITYEEMVNRYKKAIGNAEPVEQPFTMFTYSKDDMYAGGGYYECDNCKQRFSNVGYPMIHDAKYCPDCGSKSRNKTVIKGDKENEN